MHKISGILPDGSYVCTINRIFEERDCVVVEFGFCAPELSHRKYFERFFLKAESAYTRGIAVENWIRLLTAAGVSQKDFIHAIGKPVGVSLAAKTLKNGSIVNCSTNFFSRGGTKK